MQFRFTDAGRAQSRYPREKADCTVRVLALACSLSYNDAHKLLADHGRSWGRGFNLPKWFRHKGYIRTAAATYVFRWIGFPSVKGEKRITWEKFVRAFPRGVYIAGTPLHVECWRDGVLYDDKPGRQDRCFYGVWQVIETSPSTRLWLARGRRPGAPCAKRLGVVPGDSSEEALQLARTWYRFKGQRVTVEEIIHD